MEYHSGGSLPLLGRPRYCPGAKAHGGYLCETGHCCGETGCCTYYYELWCKSVLGGLGPCLGLCLDVGRIQTDSLFCCVQGSGCSGLFSSCSVVAVPTATVGPS